MAKAKAVKQSKSSQARWHGFEVGKRVQVISGDFGNARGELVTEVNGNSHVKVALDQETHLAPRDFHAGLLRLL